MEVLFVAANLPYPPTSGATIRTYNLLRRVCEGNRVHVVAFGDPERDADKLAHFEEFCASVALVRTRDTKNTPYFYVELLLNLLSPQPYIVSRFTRPAMIRAVRDALRSRHFDLIHCDFLTLSLNLRDRNGLPLVATAHNVDSVIWERYLAHEKNPLKALYIYLQYRKLLRFEERILRELDGVVCVSEGDREQMQGLCTSPRYTVVPNGVDVEYFRPRPEQEKPYRLLFTGAMDWRPNQDAVRFFLDQIYPRIKRAEPRTSLFVVGRDPTADLKAAASAHPDVTVVGTVPDMRPYLAAAAAYVVPLRIGGGTRLKILEAMAMGRPVISTPVGCEGLSVRDEQDILVADRPEDFARAVLRLFGDAALATRIGRAGRALVQKSYDWRPISAKLNEAWREAASSRRQ